MNGNTNETVYGLDQSKWTHCDNASQHGYWSADEPTTPSTFTRSIASFAARDTDSEAGENCSECCADPIRCTDQACTASCDGTNCTVQLCESDECTDEICYGDNCTECTDDCQLGSSCSQANCTKGWECVPGTGYCCFGKGAICTGNCFGDLQNSYPSLSPGMTSSSTSAYTENSPRFTHSSPLTVHSNQSPSSEFMEIDHQSNMLKLAQATIADPTFIAPLTHFPSHASCQWGSDCNFSANDASQFVEHLYSNHINPQLQTICEWNSCGVVNNKEQIPSHVLTAHPDALATDTCLWQGCNEVFGHHDVMAVAYHLQNHHARGKSLQCNWNECGEQQPGLEKLHSHIYQSHFLTDPSSGNQHPIPIMDVDVPESRSATLSENPSIEDMTNFLDNASMGDDMAEICRWRGENGELCGASFPDKGQLSNHVKNVHVTHAPKVANGFICTWEGCDRLGLPFAQRGKLDRHMQTHVVFRVCSCIQCRKEFSNINAFLQHYRTHTGDKPYKCKECNRTFAQGSALTMHRRMHTGEKPLMCTFPGCGKSFAESSNLSKHRKIHNPIGLHRCPFKGCDKSFHRMDQYKRHFKTHKTGPPMQPLKNELPSSFAFSE